MDIRGRIRILTSWAMVLAVVALVLTGTRLMPAVNGSLEFLALICFVEAILVGLHLYILMLKRKVGVLRTLDWAPGAAWTFCLVVNIIGLAVLGALY